MSTFEIFLGIGGVLGIGSAFVTVIGKLIPQRDSSETLRNNRVAELERARADDKNERAELKADVAAAEARTEAARKNADAQIEELKTRLDEVVAQAHKEVEAARKEAAEEIHAVREEAAEERRTQRTVSRRLADYAQELRAYIAGNGTPPPPDWPEGLLQ